MNASSPSDPSPTRAHVDTARAAANASLSPEAAVLLKDVDLMVDEFERRLRVSLRKDQSLNCAAIDQIAVMASASYKSGLALGRALPVRGRKQS